VTTPAYLLVLPGRRFISWLAGSGSQDLLRRLTVTDIDAYLANRSQQLGRVARNALATNLRSCLHYLYRQGEIACDLGSVVTGPTLYALENLPSATAEQAVTAVVKHYRSPEPESECPSQRDSKQSKGAGSIASAPLGITLKGWVTESCCTYQLSKEVLRRLGESQKSFPQWSTGRPHSLRAHWGSGPPKQSRYLRL
jgi:hypothetical protein